MQPGDRVELIAYGEERITRRVVAVTSAKVEVCAEGDYEAAQRGDKSRVIGFPQGDAVRVIAALTSESE